MSKKEKLSPQSDALVAEECDEIMDIIKNIQKAIRSKFNKCAKKYGFTAPQLAVMVHVHKMPGVTLHELSDHMMLTKSTVSGIVDRLSKQGVIVREIPEENRRTVKLSISEEFVKNNDILSMKKIFLSHMIVDSLKNMEPKEVEKMIYGLKKFGQLLSDNYR